MTKLAKIFLILLLASPVPLFGQKLRYTISPRNAETVLKTERIRAQVEHLTDPVLGGRATGTLGAQQVAHWLEGQFRDLALQPLGGAFLHGFHTGGGLFGRNVIGILPGSAQPARYVVVMAHYDNLGVLNGTLYPGADSNASGVAALLQLARMFRHMNDCKKTYSTGLIFVALDAKEKDLAGAEALYKLLEKQGMDILRVVNLDQLGATLAPLTKGHPNYLMMLSDEADGRRSTLENVNREQHLGLELSYDYYGSKDFTQLFYRRISDQRVFLEHGIPAVMFTSGITLNTNKPADDAASLDYPVLRKRIQLIFYYLDKVL